MTARYVHWFFIFLISFLTGNTLQSAPQLVSLEWETEDSFFINPPAHHPLCVKKISAPLAFYMLEDLTKAPSNTTYTELFAEALDEYAHLISLQSEKELTKNHNVHRALLKPLSTIKKRAVSTFLFPETSEHDKIIMKKIQRLAEALENYHHEWMLALCTETRGTEDNEALKNIPPLLQKHKNNPTHQKVTSAHNSFLTAALILGSIGGILSIPTLMQRWKRFTKQPLTSSLSTQTEERSIVSSPLEKEQEPLGSNTSLQIGKKRETTQLSIETISALSLSSPLLSKPTLTIPDTISHNNKEFYRDIIPLERAHVYRTHSSPIPQEMYEQIPLPKSKILSLSPTFSVEAGVTLIECLSYLYRNCISVDTILHQWIKTIRCSEGREDELTRAIKEDATQKGQSYTPHPYPLLQQFTQLCAHSFCSQLKKYIGGEDIHTASLQSLKTIGMRIEDALANNTHPLFPLPEEVLKENPFTALSPELQDLFHLGEKDYWQHMLDHYHFVLPTHIEKRFSKEHIKVVFQSLLENLYAKEEWSDTHLCQYAQQVVKTFLQKHYHHANDETFFCENMATLLIHHESYNTSLLQEALFFTSHQEV